MSNTGSSALNAATSASLASLQRGSLPPSVHQQSEVPFAPARLDLRIPIRTLDDIVQARTAGRRLAKQLGCSGSRVALVLTAISELARNIIMYAEAGEIVLYRSGSCGRAGLAVVARDNGPGIDDVAAILDRPETAVMQGGQGLSGLRKVMDHFDIESRPGVGTVVTCEVIAG